MARAAFVMDRIMHKIGLHGKSFIPMLIGFGCTVPAYMGSRIIDDKTDRLITMHVTTFMSCGARLPVYILVCGAFWPNNAGTVVFSIYALGVIIAIAMVKILRSTRFKGMSSPLVMELPPYRMPTLRSLMLHTWERSWLYLRKAGTIILGISIIMWFLMTFPQVSEYSRDYPTMISGAEFAYRNGELTQEQYDDLRRGYENSMAAERLEHSFAGNLGKLIEPIIKPLGFDWRLGIALISGFAAKETVVSTMGTVYGVGETDEGSESLRERLAIDPAYSKLKAYAFLAFILLYVPCMAAMAVFLRETNSWRELIFQISYTTALAWIISFAIFQGGRLIGLG
jgi:ferrous iron transport protein B